MNEKKCERQGVGIIMRDSFRSILLIKRGRCFELPSGCCGEDSYPAGCYNVVKEKTGFMIDGPLQPITVRNPKKAYRCRDGSNYHFFQILETGLLEDYDDEVKGRNRRWVSVGEIKKMARNTEDFIRLARRYKEAAKAEERSWTFVIRESIRKEWQRLPRLKIIWHEFFKELDII